MRFTPFILAALASSVIARPTSDLSFARRHPGLDLSVAAHLDIDSVVSANVFAGLSAKGAAAFTGCAIGLKAGAVDVDAKAELKAWLATSAAASIDASLKTSVDTWLTGSTSATLSADVAAGLSLYIPVVSHLAAKGGLVVSLDGVQAAAQIAGEVVLEASARASLLAFLTAQVDLDVDVKAGLHVCAVGGVSASLAVDVKTALEAYLNSSKSELEASLKASVVAWLKGTVETGVVAVGNLVDTALASTSIGVSISAGVETSGAISAPYIAYLSAFLKAQVSLDADIKASLGVCVKGGLATSLSVDAVASLSAWLASADSSLSAELKGIVLYWLSIGASVETSTSVLTAAEISEISAFLDSSVGNTISATLRGAIGVVVAGESVIALSADAVAELAAFLSGSINVNISVDIKTYLIQWLSGRSGHPNSSSSASTSATSVAVTATTATSISVSNAVAPVSSFTSLPKPVTSTVASVSALSGSVPTSISVSVPSISGSSSQESSTSGSACTCQSQ